MPQRAACEAVLLSPREASRVYAEFAARIPDSVNLRTRDLLVPSRCWERGEWTVATESAALDNWLDDEGIERCHLIAESGGAAVALRFVTTSSSRLLSLTISEPPWIGADFPSAVDVAFRAGLRRLVDLPDDEVGPAFFRLFVDGIEPPRRTVDPSFIAALRAVADEYVRAPLDRNALTEIDIPVLLIVGGRSARRMRVITEELARLFSRRMVLEVPEGHHFNLWRVGAEKIARLWLDCCVGGTFIDRTRNHLNNE